VSGAWYRPGLVFGGVVLASARSLEVEVGVEVDLGCLDALVAEPERDDGGVDAGVQEAHRGGVAQHVRGELFLVQGRAGADRGCVVFGQSAFDGVAAEAGAAAGWKQRVVRESGALGQPRTQDSDSGRRQRRDALLASLAVAADVRSSTEVNIASGQTRQFGCAQAGLGGKQDQAVVAPTDPGGSVGGGEQRVDLGFGEVGDQGAVKALGRDREHALDDRGVLGVAQRGEAKQRVDRGQPRVAGPGAVVAVVLEVVQERRDQRRVEVTEVQRRRLRSGLLVGEAQAYFAFGRRG